MPFWSSERWIIFTYKSTKPELKSSSLLDQRPYSYLNKPCILYKRKTDREMRGFRVNEGAGKKQRSSLHHRHGKDIKIGPGQGPGAGAQADHSELGCSRSALQDWKAEPELGEAESRVVILWSMSEGRKGKVHTGVEVNFEFFFLFPLSHKSQCLLLSPCLSPPLFFLSHFQFSLIPP